ncbi:hypothetical protein TWF694_007212 [Orbilia ellipsospora]|uniref:Acyltransferase 3 domain-containing protein n=1 Tax=Orbilia ellipsospora TaxID=2528407 RepID=A0AAV9XH29_9PEZI
MYDKKSDKDSIFVTVSDVNSISEPSSPETGSPLLGDKPLNYYGPDAIRNYTGMLSHRLFSSLLFLAPSFYSTKYSKTPVKITPTSWLDGLRGLASFIVFIFHYSHAYYRAFMYPYDGVTETHWWQLPIIKVAYSGPVAVSTFFIISGFALSYKTVLILKQNSTPIERQNHKLLSNIASSMFRRFPRLYIPCIGTFFLVGIFVGMGWFEVVPQGSAGELRGVVENRPIFQGNIFAQLRWAFWDYCHFVWYQLQAGNSIAKKYYRNESDMHLWTIPMEFRESMRLFVALIVLSRFRRWIRLTILSFSCVVALLYAHWGANLFLFGFLCAEIFTHMPGFKDPASVSDLPIASPSTFLYSPTNETGLTDLSDDEDEAPGMLCICLNHLKTLGCLLLLLVGLFFGSFPHHPPHILVNAGTTGFEVMEALTPMLYEEIFRFWTSIGSMMIFFALMFLPEVRGIFNTRIAQYLGKISFALYLVHGSVTRSLGYAFCHWGWAVLGVTSMKAKMLKYNDPADRIMFDEVERNRALVVIAGFFVVTPVVIWLADIFWRVLDIPSVRFARWLENKLLRK